jgi:anti-sigma regulatory factor (Ser/Thr protein kinase)
MIPTTTNNPDFSDNLDDRIAFKLSNSSYLLELLGPKLYSNPVKAVVRELLTNALDAHRAALVEKPVELTVLPSIDDAPPRLVIRDFGLGISPRQMTDIFMVIGTSSKDSDNTQHGGYGIGALTIFAVADQAFLTTYVDGIEYQYLLFRDSQQAGVPSCSLLSRSEQVFCHSGTRIEVPFSKASVREIWSSVVELTTLIPQLAKIIDPPLSQLLVAQAEDFGLLSRVELVKFFGDSYEFYSSDILDPFPSKIALFLKIGDIAYRVEPSSSRLLAEKFPDFGYFKRVTSLPGHSIDFLQRSRALNETSFSILVFKIPIGHVQLLANREEIIWTEENIDVIAQLIEPAMTELKVKLLEEIKRIDGDPVGTGFYLSKRLQLSPLYGLDLLPVNGLTLSRSQIVEHLEYLTNSTALGSSWRLSLSMAELNLISVCQKIESGASLIYVSTGGTVKNFLAKNSIQIRKTDSEGNFLKPSWHNATSHLNKLIVRCFPTAEALESELDSSVTKLLNPLVLIDKTPKKKVKQVKRPEPSKTLDWFETPQPTGLSVIDFGQYPEKISFSRASRPSDPVKYYLLEGEFSSGYSRFYQFLKPLLPPVDIYRVSGDAANLVAKRADWLSAHILFDEAILRSLELCTPVFRRIGFVPGLHPYSAGYYNPRMLDVQFCDSLVDLSRCLSTLSDLKNGEFILTPEVLDDLRLLTPHFPAICMSRYIYGHDLYPRSSAKISSFQAGDRCYQSDYRTATMRYFLKEPILFLSIIESYILLFTSQGNYRELSFEPIFERILDVLPSVGMLKKTLL